MKRIFYMEHPDTPVSIRLQLKWMWERDYLRVADINDLRLALLEDEDARLALLEDEVE